MGGEGVLVYIRTGRVIIRAANASTGRTSRFSLLAGRPAAQRRIEILASRKGWTINI